jgi:tRNA threonylcarbamoyladenosine biosynthesis protein TsaB
LATVLNINTAFETASVILSSDNEIILETQSHSQKDHASFLEPAIKGLCKVTKTNLNAIDAVSVINGPGSYTGLRVGLSSAKAICYALTKPLILLNTLDVMAYALKLQSTVKEKDILFCPLIDARRMEVFTALYDISLNVIKTYSSDIINGHFLEQERKNNKIVAGGNGVFKMQKIINDENITCINQLFLSKPAITLSFKALISKNFSNIAYSEPFYLKQVYFRK